MRTGTKLEYRQRIELAIEFILENLDNPPSVPEVADYAGFSRHHFGRVFSMAVGEPVAEFVRRLRLERAAWHLENSDQSITDVGFDAGYESLEGFSRAFREWYRVSPSEFRSQPSRHEVQSACEVHWFPSGRRKVPVLVLNQECSMIATVETINPIHVVALRHIGPYNTIGPKFQQLAQWVVKHQIPLGMGIAIYYDNPDVVAAHDLRSDAAIIVSADLVLPDSDGLDIRLEVIRGGDYAMASHYGPYDGLGDAWARFCGQAVPALGREFDDSPPFEIYTNDCSRVKPEELRTDLYVKIK